MSGPSVTPPSLSSRERAGYRFSVRMKYFLADAGLIWLALVFYLLSPYYSNFLSFAAKISLSFLALNYWVYDLLSYLLVPSDALRPSKGWRLLTMVKRLLRDYVPYLGGFTARQGVAVPSISKDEKNLLLFTLVKIIFIPLMFDFVFANLGDVSHSFTLWAQSGYQLTERSFSTDIYLWLTGILFFIDTAYFAFGYVVELPSLNNKVKSVEPTLFGWAVALICYQPFNMILWSFLVWYANDTNYFSNIHLTFAAKVISLVLVGTYVSATVALGAKGSNLTNRGIVVRGPYAFVRHPAYVTKNLTWWIAILPLLSIANPLQSLAVVVNMGALSFIYFLRAVTEERHLLADPEYVDYCQKVKYRFIPYVY